MDQLWTDRGAVRQCYTQPTGTARFCGVQLAQVRWQYNRVMNLGPIIRQRKDCSPVHLWIRRCLYYTQIYNMCKHSIPISEIPSVCQQSPFRLAFFAFSLALGASLRWVLLRCWNARGAAPRRPGGRATSGTRLWGDLVHASTRGQRVSHWKNSC